MGHFHGETRGHGAGAGEHIRYVLAPPSPLGATLPEPDATSPEYRTPIPIAATVILRACVFSADDTRRGRPTTAHYLQIGPDVAGFTSQMPVMVIDNHGYGPLEKDGVDHPSWLYTYRAGNPGSPVFGSPPDLATPLTATVRGSSSASFPKKSYNLKLTDAFGSKRAQPLLGSAYAFEKWALVGPWTFDRSYLHNSFIYTLSNRLGRWAPRTQLTEVFYNSNGDGLGQTDYDGIYILTDRIEINAGRLALAPLATSDLAAPAVTGGYILKLDLKADKISLIAGNGKKGFTGNGGPAKQATLSGPKGVAFDAAGNAWIADTESHSIRMVDMKTGNLELMIGTGKKGDGPDGDPLKCQLARPHGVFVDKDGSVYVGDSENHRVRVWKK